MSEPLISYPKRLIVETALIIESERVAESNFKVIVPETQQVSSNFVYFTG